MRKSSDYFDLVRVILLFAILLAGCGLHPVEPTLDEDESGAALQVLFIGNSYTFANDMPQMFAKLAQEAGYQVEVTMLAEGGWTLNKHAQSDRTITLIRDHPWDYVILQEQSVLPAKSEGRQQSMYPAIRALDAEIRATGANTILFMTWGRRDGLPADGFADYHEMQAAITEGYLEIGQALDVAVAPVGDAWKLGVDAGGEPALWAKDGSHPSKAGSYLAACVFYGVIIDVSPSGNAYFHGFKADTAQKLQAYAESAVFQEQ